MLGLIGRALWKEEKRQLTLQNTLTVRVFQLAWREIPQQPSHINVSKWLCMIAARETFKHEQSKTTRLSRLSSAFKKKTNTFTPDPIFQSEDPDHLLRLLNTLPLLQRFVFLLKVIEGFSDIEVQQSLNVKDSAIANALHNATAALELRYSHDFPEQ